MQSTNCGKNKRKQQNKLRLGQTCNIRVDHVKLLILVGQNGQMSAILYGSNQYIYQST